LKKIADILRLFWGCVFIDGVIINIVIGITNPASYNKGGEFAWPNFLQSFWVNSVVPNMVPYIVVFAIIELILGLLILNKEKLAKLGLAGAAIFGIGLLLLGLGAERGNWTARIPNLIFEATILYSLFFNYDRTLIQTVRPKKELTRTSVIGS
jgi:energy-converting hydrogenase Eha subunit A